MEKLINNNKIIVQYLIYFILLLYPFNGCNLTKSIIKTDEVVSVALQVLDNKNLLYIEKKIIKEFINDINDKEAYYPKGELIFSGYIIIKFKNNSVLNYEITNGGFILFDGKKKWLLKKDIIKKYWFTLEENRFIIPPSCHRL